MQPILDALNSTDAEYAPVFRTCALLNSLLLDGVGLDVVYCHLVTKLYAALYSATNYCLVAMSPLGAESGPCLP